LGPNHPSVSNRLRILISIYEKQGRHDLAEPLLLRDQEIQKHNFGPQSLEVAQNYAALLNFYLGLGKRQHAEQILHQALDIYDTHFPDHPNRGLCLDNLAAIYVNTKRYADAEPLYQLAIRILEKAHGPHDAILAPTMTNLAAVYTNMGRKREAEVLHRRIISIRRGTAGPHDSLTADSLNNLGLFFLRDGRLDAAEPLFQEAHSIHLRSQGPESQSVAFLLINLATVTRRRGRPAQAEPLHLRAIAILDKHHDRSHPHLILAYKGYAACLHEQKRPAEAAAVLRLLQQPSPQNV